MTAHGRGPPRRSPTRCPAKKKSRNTAFDKLPPRPFRAFATLQ
jgi:hypothetical protein